MSALAAAVFAMSERGHFKRMLPVIDGLARAGVAAHVFTDAAFRRDVERAGGIFVDLFARHTVDDADRSSIPIPSRFVTFAARFGERIADEAAMRRPTFVVHDTFAVVGRVVANRLGVPRVNVCACHNLAPAPTLQALARDPRVRTSDACRAAVDALRERYGLLDASPFSYIVGVSPDLNLYCEPPQFLLPEERDPFEPLAFFGSLWPEGVDSRARSAAAFHSARRAPLRIYASFGTIIWRYYEDAAVSAIEALCEAAASRRDVEVLIGLGGAGPRARITRQAPPNVRVEDYCDQWHVLGEASVYLTHQGLNSTHEAIYQRVPMISYPFFSDQPGLAARCQAFGLAVPLVDALRRHATADDVRAALDRVESDRSRMAECLDAAREWEMETIRARPAVIERVIALAASGRASAAGGCA